MSVGRDVLTLLQLCRPSCPNVGLQPTDALVEWNLFKVLLAQVAAPAVQAVAGEVERPEGAVQACTTCLGKGKDCP